VSALNVILNVLWLLTGGIWMALGWLVAAAIMAITIIGLPWARAAFNIAVYTLLPFGHVALPRDEVEGQGDLGTGSLGVLGNILWLVLAGWWLALGHLITAVGLALTVIGLPFAWAHLKLAGISLWPIGKTIVSAEEAAHTCAAARAGLGSFDDCSRSPDRSPMLARGRRSTVLHQSDSLPISTPHSPRTATTSAARNRSSKRSSD
jgi:uncharacterized membrane protein YccF (DUF307 family)